jgi:hypothetical protein
MKLKPIFLISFFFLLSVLTVEPAVESDPGFQSWWQVELKLSVSGDYGYNHNNKDHKGEYSFEILSTAAMEQDCDKDYILYQGETNISVQKWREIINKNTPVTTDLAGKIKPDIRLNYVLKENRKLYFDFEVFLKSPVPGDPDPLKEFLLPRSALNKSINHHDRYNRDVFGGSNKIRMPEKLILKQTEAGKEFQWQWQRRGTGFFNTHSVKVELKIIKK